MEIREKYLWFGIVIFGFSILIGIVIWSRVSQNNQSIGQESQIQNLETINEINENEIGNYLVSVSQIEKKVSPTANLIFQTKYQGCGHIINQREKVEGKLVNLTEEEFNDLYANWTVERFGNEEIILYQEVPGECGEHFQVRENNGKVCIYKISPSNDLILEETTQIETKYLPDIDQKNLQNGVTIIGQEALISYIENFE